MNDPEGFPAVAIMQLVPETRVHCQRKSESIEYSVKEGRQRVASMSSSVNEFQRSTSLVVVEVAAQFQRQILIDVSENWIRARRRTRTNKWSIISTASVCVSRKTGGRGELMHEQILNH
jgi:hypothetical protein